jgi:hypothetical protein
VWKAQMRVFDGKCRRREASGVMRGCAPLGSVALTDD